MIDILQYVISFCVDWKSKITAMTGQIKHRILCKRYFKIIPIWNQWTKLKQTWLEYALYDLYKMCVFHFDRKSKMAAITWNGYNIRPIIEWSFMKFYVFLCWSEIKDGDHHRTSLTYMCNLSETTEQTNSILLVLYRRKPKETIVLGSVRPSITLKFLVVQTFLYPPATKL